MSPGFQALVASWRLRRGEAGGGYRSRLRHSNNERPDYSYQEQMLPSSDEEEDGMVLLLLLLSALCFQPMFHHECSHVRAASTAVRRCPDHRTCSI